MFLGDIKKLGIVDGGVKEEILFSYDTEFLGGLYEELSGGDGLSLFIPSKNPKAVGVVIFDRVLGFKKHEFLDLISKLVGLEAPYWASPGISDLPDDWEVVGVGSLKNIEGP